MDRKKIITGIVIAAIVGITRTFFVLHDRISKLEGNVAAQPSLHASLHDRISRLEGIDVAQPRSVTKPVEPPPPSWPRSPDGKYQAALGNGDEHSQEKGNDPDRNKIVKSCKKEFEAC